MDEINVVLYGINQKTIRITTKIRIFQNTFYRKYRCLNINAKLVGDLKTKLFN